MPIPTAMPVDDEVTGMEALTAQDRCDRCGAQAYVRVALPVVTSDLLFCAHHMREHETKLALEGAVILRDERPALTPPA